MIILKIIAKVVALPLMFILLIAYWIGLFCTGIVSTILGILSTLFWGFAIVGFLFGALTGQETLEMMAVAFVVFIIPQICHWLMEVLGTFRLVLGEFIRS